jgi:MFS family permease
VYSLAESTPNHALEPTPAFGWSRAAIAGVFSSVQLTGAAVALGVGMLSDRISVRRLGPLGAGLIALGLILASRAQSLAMLYVAYGCIFALGYCSAAVSAHRMGCAHRLPERCAGRWHGPQSGAAVAPVHTRAGSCAGAPGTIGCGTACATPGAPGMRWRPVSAGA